ncbi:MAG: hypothetical protein FJW23_03505 [Acidimicrobiia bacterium]|nr:hypothetical protein [Acidimicrobiia bacterium]
MTKFVIVAAARSGSNLLCTLLDSHPRVLCHHELYNPAGVFYALRLRGGAFTLGTLEERDRDPLGFLPRVWDADLGHSCVGFKMTRGQHPAVLDAVLGDPGVRTIVLRRANRLKTYVSEQRAQATGVWEAYDHADVPKDRPLVRVDVAALRQHIAEQELFYAGVDAALAQSGAPALAVTYERLFDPDEQARMLGFLGLRDTRVPLSAASIKQNSSDLRDLISNFDELASALRHSACEAELRDRAS